MLLTCILIPLFGSVILAFQPRLSEKNTRVIATSVAGIPLALLAFLWYQFDPSGPLFQFVQQYPWIPALGAGFRFGVDGIALSIATMSALLFTIAAVFPVDYRGKQSSYLAWILFLECVCLGLFLSLDLLLFYVFFDLSLVGMYFLIAIWGHENREGAALKFVLYTFAGSLIMLLGFLSLILVSKPITFDMRTLIEQQPLAGSGLRGTLTLFAILVGLAIKTPVFPFHTWLPVAHVKAPAPASMILAGVLLKMGTFGLIRIGYSMFNVQFSMMAPWIGVVAVISIIYGALVALGQRNIKERIAYTSVTHMGYVVLGIAMAFTGGATSIEARRLALNGATLEMIAHGLITGSLFLLCGSIWQRLHSYNMDEISGIATRAKRLAFLAILASFASLGLPGFAGFVAEFQIFSASIAANAWLAGFALLGVLITAALFLQLLQRCFLGKTSDLVSSMTDLGRVESVSIGLLMGLTIFIGLAPRFVLDLIDGASQAIVGGR